MAKFSTLLTHLGILLIAIIFLTRIQISQSASFKNLPSADLFNDDDNSGVEEDRRMYDLNQLRRFLLTANAEQRAAKREQQDFYKRELVIFFLKKEINFLFFCLF